MKVNTLPLRIHTLVTNPLDTLAQRGKPVTDHHPRKTSTMDFPDLSDTYGQFWKYAIEPMRAGMPNLVRQDSFHDFTSPNVANP